MSGSLSSWQQNTVRYTKCSKESCVIMYVQTPGKLTYSMCETWVVLGVHDDLFPRLAAAAIPACGDPSRAVSTGARRTIVLQLGRWFWNSLSSFAMVGVGLAGMWLNRESWRHVMLAFFSRLGSLGFISRLTEARDSDVRRASYVIRRVYDSIHRSRR